MAADNDQAETRALTIRLPRGVHEQLRREAFDKHTSMNAIIASELEQRYREPDPPQAPEPVIMTHAQFEPPVVVPLAELPPAHLLKG